MKEISIKITNINFVRRQQDEYLNWIESHKLTNKWLIKIITYLVQLDRKLASKQYKKRELEIKKNFDTFVELYDKYKEGVKSGKQTILMEDCIIDLNDVKNN